MNLTREWFTTPDLAGMALPGIPSTPANVRAMADRERWQRADWSGKRWRIRKEKGGGVEYHYTVLPPDARNGWIAAFTPVGGAAEWELAQAAGGFDANIWDNYWAAGQKAREKADARLQIVRIVLAAINSGRPTTTAVLDVCAKFGCGKSSVFDWLAQIDGVPECDWTPALLPKHKGRAVCAECSEEAWSALYAEYARQARPTFSDAYRKIWLVREENNWIVPSKATLWRRMQAVDPAALMLARHGKQALKDKFPAQKRDKTVFGALEAVNADGHKWDVWVKWPGPNGKVCRPMMVGFQDIYSNMFLSWRLDTSENKYLIQLAFGDMIETYGIPKHCWLDNGRGFTAKTLTGGIKNRYRYKYKEAEPDGIMRQLNIDVHFTDPYSGQSKPIERGFGDLARRVAKDHRFGRAYCGNSPKERPDEFDVKHAVPLDLFLQVVAEGIRDHNEREDRRTDVCKKTGLHSFGQVFRASYEASTEIRRASPRHKPLWLLVAENVRTRKDDNSIHFYDNRYWSKELEKHIGETLTVRFDPDHLQKPLHVYDARGVFLCQAECIAAVGFNDVEAAKKKARDLATYRRNAKENDQIERGSMTTERVIALTAIETEAPPVPETKVVRMFRGNAALAVRPVADEDREAETDELFAAALQSRRAQYGQLRLVEEAGDD